MVQLFEHQIEAVKKIKNGCVLWGGVGVGKSLTVLAYYVEKESPKDIYVITTAKKRDSLDWIGDAAKFGIGTSHAVTLHGRIIVDSWNNIGDYVGIEDAFFVFDEQRLVGTGAWVKAFQKIAKKNRWVMLSATPGDTWMDYAPLFVANNLYKNITQFKREHVVYAPYSRFPKIERYIETRTLEKYRNMILVEMPVVKKTTRVVEDVYCDFDKTMFNQITVKRWNPFEDQPIKDVSEMFILMKKVVNSDASRLQHIRRLMEIHPKLIVFYNFNYELDILRTLGADVPIAEWNGHRHQPIPSTDRWVYLVQYVSGAEGWNCIETDAMVFYSMTYSYKNFEQAQGRIDRINTSYLTLFYYVLMSNSVIDRAIRKSLDQKETFNERKWAVETMGLRDLAMHSGLPILKS